MVGINYATTKREQTVTRIYYDTEFIDDGNTIELISIGMVADNGEEFYCINGDLSLKRLLSQPWHLENTVPSLPIRTVGDYKINWLAEHIDANLIKPKAEVRDEVYDFILRHTPIGGQVELWAWYGAYDHVALAQLWGPMVKLPRLVPMYTNDLKQEMTRKEKLGNPRLHYIMPMHDNKFTKHNALDDAKLLKIRAEWLDAI